MIDSAHIVVIDNSCNAAILPALTTGGDAMTPKERNCRLTVEWLRRNLAYDPQTGVFKWKLPGFGRTVGKPIGTKPRADAKNYLMMKVSGELFYAHRLAWLYHYGEWPAGHVDHIDGNRTNNAIANLRVATPAQNSARRRTTRKLAPSRGVFPHGAGFVARLHHGGKRHYLGYFKTVAEARAAYEAKAREIHGEFAYPQTTDDQDSLVAAAVARSPHRDWLLVASPGFGVH